MIPVSMYVVVTVFNPADGKGCVTRAWGTYASRATAVAAARELRQQDESTLLRPSGTLTCHVCEIQGEEPS